MKFPWILAGLAGGLAIYVFVNNAQQTAPSTGSPDVDAAANKVSSFGTKQRVKGTGGDLLGSVKEGVGNVTGDKELQGEGVADQVVGQVKDTVGKAAHAVSDAAKEVNQ